MMSKMVICYLYKLIIVIRHTLTYWKKFYLFLFLYIIVGEQTNDLI